MNQAVLSLQFVNKGLVHMQAKNGQVYYNKLEFCFVVNYSGMCGSRKYPYPPQIQKTIGNSDGEEGFKGSKILPHLHNQLSIHFLFL